MTSATRSPLSRSTEDYLKAILALQTEAATAQTTAIAESLAVAPASVSGMLKRLTEAGLLEHEPYKGVTLTAAGRRAALKVLRRHRVLESYLMSKLGYDWDTVHEEAERLENAVSDQLVERMAMALGNPRYDPHGAPIPTTSGDIERPEHIPLTDIPVGRLAELRMVSDRDPDKLRYLATLGLKPGATFEVLSRQPFLGPVAIRVAGPIARDHMVGHELAGTLWCALVEEDAG